MPQTVTNTVRILRCFLQILTVPQFWCHLAHSFERAFLEAEGALPKPKGQFFPKKNEAKEMTPKLLAKAKVCSESLEIFVTSCGICRSVGVSLRKREHKAFGQTRSAQK